MRVAMLAYHSSPLAPLGGKHTGGMNVYVRELSRQLAARGHQVDIFTRGIEREEIELAGSENDAVRLVALPAGPARPLERDELADHVPEFANAVLEYARSAKLNYDVVHAHYWMSGLAGAQLKAAWGAALVVMFHTLGLVKNRIEALGPLESERRIRAERQVIAAADIVVAATPAEQADLQWLYEVRSSNITIIPPGVDLELFQPMDQATARAQIGADRDGPLVLYVGRIEALKGIDTLIRALPRLPAARRPHVHIIGGEANLASQTLDSEMARLRALAAELDVADSIDFLGKREQEQLVAHYTAADVVVVPSHSESFGMVALEAMACGRPVIASRVGGLAYVVQDGVSGFHVQEGDPAELAERLKQLLDDDELRFTLGLGGRRLAAGYTWAQVAEKIEVLYLNLAVNPDLKHG
jgi:D-inositol-3-phosphate glycosyltransferase